MLKVAASIRFTGYSTTKKVTEDLFKRLLRYF